MSKHKTLGRLQWAVITGFISGTIVFRAYNRSQNRGPIKGLSESRVIAYVEDQYTAVLLLQALNEELYGK